MAQSIEESLLEAIQKDDLKSFNLFEEKARGGKYRLGRFPVLSLLYLYKSKKILSVYEESFLKISEYEALNEPVNISKKFSHCAGKCLRLYLNEVVTPLEMLLILDKTSRLKRVYPLTKPTAAVKERLKAIYSVKYGKSVKFEGKDIIIERRPLSYREKKTIATACLCSVLAVAVAVGVPVTTVALIPKPVEGEVRKLSQIDFGANKEYTLKQDLVLPENYSVGKVNCKITGEGNKLIFGKGASLGEFNGRMSDLTIESSGDPVFTTVSEKAEIKDVIINVSADVSAEGNGSLIAGTNYGTIDGVTVNISGSVNALAPEQGVTQEFVFGGLVQFNAYKSVQSSGMVKNCTVNYNGFSLTGAASANAVFGGVAGINSGIVEGCTVTGEITSDTFDIAGICYGNNGTLTGNINAANISQTTADGGWNPIACGIVVENIGRVEYCENRGNISAVSTREYEEGQDISVSASGIVNLNGGTVLYCKNSGAVTAEGNSTAFTGGIAARSYGAVTNCVSVGDITVSAGNIFVGGIAGRCDIATDFFNRPVYDFIRNCISENRISVTNKGEKDICAGGIVGFVMEGSYVNSDEYFGGGVCDSFFTGECVSGAENFGNIVGACGANIYANNSYLISGVEYHNFDGNIYIENSLPAFGATVTGDGEFVPAEDKGASSSTAEDIKNSEKYQSILKKLEK